MSSKRNKPEPAPALEISALTLPIKTEIIPYTIRRKSRVGKGEREKDESEIERRTEREMEDRGKKDNTLDSRPSIPFKYRYDQTNEMGGKKPI